MADDLIVSGTNELPNAVTRREALGLHDGFEPTLFIIRKKNLELMRADELIYHNEPPSDIIGASHNHVDPYMKAARYARQFQFDDERPSVKPCLEDSTIKGEH